MVKPNKTCMCCGTKYSYCPSCSRADALAPTWKSEFCSETCMSLWTTLTRYGMSRITKSEAKSVISELDLKPIDTYAACVQRDYAKVMKEDKKLKRNKRIEIKPIDYAMNIEQAVVEEQQIVVEAIEPAHEVVIIEKE